MCTYRDYRHVSISGRPIVLSNRERPNNMQFVRAIQRASNSISTHPESPNSTVRTPPSNPLQSNPISKSLNFECVALDRIYSDTVVAQFCPDRVAFVLLPLSIWTSVRMRRPIYYSKPNCDWPTA